MIYCGPGTVSKTALVKVDVPELVNQCEKEFTVNWGAKREKRAKQIKGSLENGDDSTVQQTLNLNYKRCRDKV